MTLEFDYNTMWLEAGKNHYHGKCFRTTSVVIFLKCLNTLTSYLLKS